MVLHNLRSKIILFTVMSVLGGGISSCAQVNVPGARNVDIPNPVQVEKRREAVNERPDSVVYLPLGEDVLVPERMVGQNLPNEQVGPFELRGETLAGALQLILADYDISIAFETDQGMTRQVTVANLKGALDKVVNRVCSLADLYCSYEDGTIVVKETQTFTVVLPPLGDEDGGTEYITNVITGLSAVIGNNGSTPVSDPTTRTIIYSASQRTSQLAENYFQRLRANTAMIVFETYIWEVSLDADNATGVRWDEIGRLGTFGKFNTSFNVGASGLDASLNPISIGLPTTNAINASPSKLIEFLSTFGAVKAISQPQITVLSGASAELRVADTENYVSEVTQTISGDSTATSVTTDSVESGFTLGISSSWDKSTVYANIAIDLSNVDQIDNFDFSTAAGGGRTTIQLPQTTERELKTQIRVRPGDSVLIAGLVRESDNFTERGLGFMKPILPDNRASSVENLELVIMLRPRVVVYTAKQDAQYRGQSNNRAQNVLQSTLKKYPTVPAYDEPARIEPAAPAYNAPSSPQEPLGAIIEDVTMRSPVVASPPPVIAVAPRAVTPVALPPVVAPPVPLAVPSAPALVTTPTPVLRAQPSYVDSGYRSTGGLTAGKDLYTPRRSQYNAGGFVSGQQDLTRQSSASSVPSYVPAAPSQNSLRAPVIAPQQQVTYAPPVYPAPSSTAQTGSVSPLSPNVYNQAQKMNVYDIYNGGQ